MAELNFGKTVTLKQAAALIASCPENRFMLQGEPGIGKSSLLKELSKQFPDHAVSYIDVPNMDLGDIAMPVIDHDSKTTKYYPNSRFNMHTGKPVIIMLDEFSKGMDPVKNMLHPLLEKANPRLGDIPVHPDSIIFMTGNMASDGVGDNMKAHTRNRIVPVTVRKPNSDEWINWAVDNNISPEVMAWVRQFPQVLASYIDGAQEGNPFIFQPKKVQAAFVTPRSLETASNIVSRRDQLDYEVVISALTGAMGEAGARGLEAFVTYADQLPVWESIISSPTSAQVPRDPGACAVVAFGAIAKVTKDTMDKFMTYLERFESEWQATFCISIAKSNKQAIAFSSKKFSEWVTKNQDLL
jgi:hypothetical protein